MGFSDDRHAHRRDSLRFPVPYLNGTTSCILDGLRRKWFAVQLEQRPYLQPRHKFWTGSWQKSQSLIRWAWVELAMIESRKRKKIYRCHKLRIKLLNIDWQCDLLHIFLTLKHFLLLELHCLTFVYIRYNACTEYYKVQSIQFGSCQK